MSSWGLGDAAFKAAIEVMKAQAGDSEEALANIAMMEPMIRESMVKMMVEIAKDTVTNHSATGVERMPIESLPHEGNRFTLTAKERTIELEWQDPVLLVWEQGVEAMKIP